MTESTVSNLVVLKFGGTSVSNLPNWRNIASIVQRRRSTGARVLVVHSAVSGITDRLEKLLLAAQAGVYDAQLEAIEERHRTLAEELGVGVGPGLQASFDLLRKQAAQIAASGAVDDRTRALVMAQGELMSTDLGARFLTASGIETAWLDARQWLHAEERDSASARANYLNATCVFTPDAAFRQHVERGPAVALTQGFIASNAASETVLLGRGGSDTSGAYFAAKLQAARLEIWTDVPGMFSANPRSTPTARLLHALHYDEAQEIASSGAKVLHPRCILPAKQGGIPVWVYATQSPDMEGTHISRSSEGAAQVKAVCVKKGITLVSLESPGMWHQVGFLADAFQVFKRHGMSVDQISTSETTVTVSLDPAANSLDAAALEALIKELSSLCRAQLIGPCSQVSLVGRNIRGILHQMGTALELFADQRIYMVSQAANDLNFTFVVDEDQGDRLVQELHDLLIRPVRGDRVLGPTWEQLHSPQAPLAAAAARLQPWWRTERERLLAIGAEHSSAYVYSKAQLRHAARSLREMQSLDRVFFAIKANPHPEILRLFADEGLGFECVSRGEVERVLDANPDIARDRILFTPNFAGREEYAWALEQGIHVTIDNLYVLRQWPELFRNRPLLVRVDGGIGRGHHHHVRTAGAHSKFGVPLDELAELSLLTQEIGAKVVGLHAHSGSGVFEVGSWSETAQVLLTEAKRFPELRYLNVGGGLGVPESLDQEPLDLAAVDKSLAGVHAALPGCELWLEPGRYLVAAAGVLLARVTQLKSKDDVHYVGVATGMNSLIRPALYGAWHDIFNLTHIDAPADQVCNVVGPICETGDFLGHERNLPKTGEGDVLLIANGGAYGHAMSSHYNLREPAVELLI
jgi:diaminopimelate decarboxylase/aspartate kinase